MRSFVLGEEEIHHAGDVACAECWEPYPAPCQCGGLVHAAGTGEEDLDGNPVLLTLCDTCGRSEDEIDEDRARG
jgi:hypothetical protein